MEKKPKNYNVLKVPVFPPKISKRGAHIFWLLWENPGIVEKDFFSILYPKPKRYDIKKQQMRQLEIELSVRTKGNRNRRKRLSRLKCYFKKINNRRYGNDKMWVNLFCGTNKNYHPKDRRQRILTVLPDFFVLAFSQYYKDLSDLLGSDVPFRIHQKAHLLNKYYGPYFWNLFLYRLCEVAFDDRSYLSWMRDKDSESEMIKAVETVTNTNADIFSHNAICIRCGKMAVVPHCPYCFGVFCNAHLDPMIPGASIISNSKIKTDGHACPQYLSTIRTKHQNPYSVFVRLIEQAFYDGLNIFAFHRNKEEFFKEHDDPWTKFAYEMVYCHWPLYLVLAERSPIEAIILDRSSTLMNKYKHRLYMWSEEKKRFNF